jgi:hypothetical protein
VSIYCLLRIFRYVNGIELKASCNLCTDGHKDHNTTVEMLASCELKEGLGIIFFLVSLGGAGLSPLDTSATVGLLYQPRMIDDDDYGTVGGMRIGRGNLSTRRKPAPVPLCPP